MRSNLLRLALFCGSSVAVLFAQSTQLGTLRVGPSALQFTGVAGQGATPPQTLYLINDTSFQVNATGQWSGTSTDASGTFPVQATFTQTGNTLTGSISDALGDSGPVSGTIVGSTFAITFTTQGITTTVVGTVSQSAVAGSFNAFSGGSLVDSGTFALTRQGTAPGLVTTLSWTQQAGTITGASGWLTSQPPSGSSTSTSGQFSTITVSAQTSGLAAGQYGGQITIASPGAANSPIVIPVFLNVLPAGTRVSPQVRPAGLIFSGTAGGGVLLPQALQISTASSANVQVTITPVTLNTSNWLNASPLSAQINNNSPASVNVTASPGFLSPGSYQGQVNLSFSDGSPTQIVNVLLVVASQSQTPQARLPVESVCGATTLLAVARTTGSNFSSPTAWPTPLQALVVDDCGVFANQATVVASFSNGDPAITLVSLGNGIFDATWTPVNSGANATVTFTAKAPPLKQAQVTLTGNVNDNPGVPAIYAGGIVSAANYSGVVLPPGGIISIFGKNLAQTGAAASTPLSSTLGGLTLTAAGQNLPLFYTSGGQVNAQLPAELHTGTVVAVVASTKTSGSGSPLLAVPAVVTIGPTVPSMFSVNQDGKGQGVIVDASNRLLDGKQATASAGQTVVIYCTGLGATSPAVPSGQASPSNPAATVTPLPQVTIGGQNATVAFAGLAPTLVGLYQINVTVPAGATGSAVPVVITQNAVMSNTVTMVVH
jgi:uncharacterized protein (TIGR03437 family)